LAAVALPLVVEPAHGVSSLRRAPSHIPSLDGLRAASFLLVFAAHAGLQHVIPGAFGVTVFFFLSGFLITTLMRGEVDRTGRVSLTGFYVRRALRILPPFYIVLGAATLLAGVGFVGGALLPEAVASQALHFSNYWIAAHGWTGIAMGTGVYWSLAVEEHFYLLFPAVFILLTRLRLTGRQKALGFWGVCALVLAWRCVLLVLLGADVERLSLCSDTRIDSIAFGCALAVWHNPVLDRSSERHESPFWRWLVLPAGIGLLLATFLARGPVFRETLRYTLQGIGLTPVFIMAVRHPGWPLFRPLNWRPMRLLGTVSYTLYLVHHVILEAVDRHLPWHGGVNVLFAFLLSLAIACAMYFVVEKPCARLRRQIHGEAPPVRAHHLPSKHAEPDPA
jgi:peptidoglycan/LPS O-acetylase OafA/YrhL